MNCSLLVSVIIPVYNARPHIGRAIDAVMNSAYRPCELIVVDDASTDGSAEVARTCGATVIAMEHQSGPAAARNRGAGMAKGDILLFVDSDVLIETDTVARIVEDFSKHDIAAVFGSYDDEPEAKNFLSQYKNLCHHFVHQQSCTEAATFWAGCGAIRRDVFDTADGFDEQRYSKPSIEDIELGYRIKRLGFRILLDKELQVKHLKKWNFRNLMRADIF
ncbi:MAG: glycosyltransferase, partial [Desulfoferrobacter sp.]